MTVGTMSMTRDRGLVLTLAEGLVMTPPPAKRPRMINVKTATGMEYFILERTTPPISAPWEPAEAMVVSEMGARLSPKAAPETNAPTINPGETPAITPTGKRIGMTIILVPTEVPVERDSIQAIRKEIAANRPPVILALITKEARV